MVQGTRRTGFTDARLVRLLARLGDTGMDGGATDFADRLGGWLRWTDAMPLYAVLQDDLPAAIPRDDQDTSSETAEADCRTVHATLTRAIADNAPWVVRPLPRARRSLARPALAPMETIADFPFYRRHYLAQQQAMEDGITPVRARLRDLLATRSPAMARLAAVDAVMERVLGHQEHRLLAGVPPLLEQRFTRLRDQAAAAAHGAAPAAWQQGFQHELQEVLLAELDLRWQPVEGLLGALRGPH